LLAFCLKLYNGINIESIIIYKITQAIIFLMSENEMLNLCITLLNSETFVELLSTPGILMMVLTLPGFVLLFVCNSLQYLRLLTVGLKSVLIDNMFDKYDLYSYINLLNYQFFV